MPIHDLKLDRSGLRGSGGFNDIGRGSLRVGRGPGDFAVEDRPGEDGPQGDGRHPSKFHVCRLLLLSASMPWKGLVPRGKGSEMKPRCLTHRTATAGDMSKKVI